MKLRILAYATIVGCALGATSATAQREAREHNLHQSSVTSVASFVEKWQQRILSQNLSVADPQNWGVRNLPKFASFSAERLELAMQATSVAELEALLVSAPVATGTNLATLMAAKPGNISLDAMLLAASKGDMSKADPSTAPGTYADLMFTALNPCRILDSRVSQGGSGPFLNGVSRIVKIGPYATGYQTGAGAQGGSASSCGLNTRAGGTDIAAVMVAVSSFTQTGPGYLTFYSATTADPSASVVSMFYTAGPVQTAFVVMPTDSIAPVYSRGISRMANTEVSIDIVGYFARNRAAALDCVSAGARTTNSLAPGAVTFFDAPACPAGYTATVPYCWTNTAGVVAQGSGINSNIPGGTAFCAWWNATGPAASVVYGNAMCCRVPGR